MDSCLLKCRQNDGIVLCKQGLVKMKTFGEHDISYIVRYLSNDIDDSMRMSRNTTIVSICYYCGRYSFKT